MSNIFEQIKNLYTVDSYYDKYGSSVMFTIFIVGIVISLISYFTLQSQLFNLRIQNRNGTLKKCSPFTIPIYGNILNSQPAPGQTKYSKIFEDTGTNLNTCINNILSDLLDILLQPFYAALGIIVGNTNSIKSTIENNGGIVKIFVRMMHLIVAILMSALKTIIYGIADILNSVVNALVQGTSSMNSLVRWSDAAYEGVLVYGFKRIFYFMNKIVAIILGVFALLIILVVFFWFSLMWPVAIILAVILIAITIILVILISVQFSGASWASKNDITLNASLNAPELKPIFQPGINFLPLPQKTTKLEFFGKNRYSPTVKYTGNLKDPERKMEQGTWNLGENITRNGSWERGGGINTELGSINNWSGKGPIYLLPGNPDWFRPADASVKYGAISNVDNSTTIGKNPYIFGPLHGYNKMVILRDATMSTDKKSCKYTFSEIIDIQQNDVMIPAAFMDGGACSKYLTTASWDICYIQGSGLNPLSKGSVVVQFKMPRSHDDIKGGGGLKEAEEHGKVRMANPSIFTRLYNDTQQGYIMVSKTATTKPASNFTITGQSEWENLNHELTTLAQLRFQNITNERIVNACFGKDTVIPLKTNPTSIDNIKPGDKLENGDTITSIFKVDAIGHNVHNINGIKVSSNHKIWINKEKWVFARDYLNSEECTYTHPYLYCINTTSKKLTLNNIDFADWDEIEPEDIIKIKDQCKSLLPKQFNTQHIHKYLDGGFAGDTLCTLNNGNVVRLSELNINDELKTGEKIKGLVIIDASQYKTLKLLKGETCDIVCGPNIRYTENENRNMTTIDLEESILNKNKTEYLYSKLYHVITDTKTIIIDGVVCYDYDGVLDKLLKL